MKYTSNHNFKLPAPSDTIDVEVLNENFTNIDALIKTLESAKADKNSPSFTGAPTAPTASSSTNSTQIATTAFVQGLIQGIQTALSGKADKNSPSFTGTPKSPTPLYLRLLPLYIRFFRHHFHFPILMLCLYCQSPFQRYLHKNKSQVQ